MTATTLPLGFMRRHGVLLRKLEAGVATLALRADANNSSIAEAQRHLAVNQVAVQPVSNEIFESWLREAYESGQDAAAAAGGLDEASDLSFLAQDLPEQADLLESDDDAPIIRLINALLAQAVRDNASDIHIEPYENRLIVRLRIDGVLREAAAGSDYGRDVCWVGHRRRSPCSRHWVALHAIGGVFAVAV